MTGYTRICKVFAGYHRLPSCCWCTSGAGPAAPEPPAITSAPVPAAILISLTPSPSARHCSDMPK